MAQLMLHQNNLKRVDRQMANLRLKDLINESVFNANEREDSRRKYRIPEWQRFPSWPLSKEQYLVDSVMRNYPIHGIITTGHYDTKPFYYIQDGQTRLNALQRFLINKYTWNERIFSELTADEQEHFRSYDLSVTTITFDDEDPDALSEASTIFERLNAGKPLTSNEKYHNRIQTPVLHFILNELRVHPDLRFGFDTFIGKIGVRKSFPLLGDMVGAVLTIALRQLYKHKTSYDINSQYLNTLTKPHKDEVILFFKCYFNILTQALFGLAKPRKEYGKLTGVLGLAIYDWIKGSPTLHRQQQQQQQQQQQPETIGASRLPKVSVGERPNSGTLVKEFENNYWASPHRDVWVWFVIQQKTHKKFKDNIFISLQKGHRQNLDVQCIVARVEIAISAFSHRNDADFTNNMIVNNGILANNLNEDEYDDEDEEDESDDVDEEEEEEEEEESNVETDRENSGDNNTVEIEGCRTMSECLTHGQRIKHMIGTSDIWIGTYDDYTKKIVHNGIQYHYLSSFSSSHYASSRPDRTSRSNGWLECYCEITGKWVSTFNLPAIKK